MSFSQLLHQYFRALDCTAAELADASELSKSMISRYLSGDRVPSVQGRSLQRLSQGIAKLSRRTPGERFDAEDVYRQFYLSLSGIEIGFEAFVDNLNLLMSSLELTNSELARALNFDPSYISRILVGQRRPADLSKFLTDVSQYISRRFTEPMDLISISELTGCTPEQAADPERCALEINRFLGSAGVLREDPVQGFLAKLDAFDLDEYIRAIPFGDMPSPGPGFQFPRARHYRGLEEMMAAELDFLRLTAQSRAREDVFSYSEMPLEQMSQNSEFLRSWIFCVAQLLKKGLRIQVIHDVQRPFQEMLVGLEAWIPLYMTGQIAPYYFKAKRSDLFLHHLKVSGAAALFGEAIVGHHTEGRYYLTNSREDLQYFRSESRLMLKKALPLMEIYTKRQRKAYIQARAGWLGKGHRRMLFSSIPLSVAAPETVETILLRNELDEMDRAEILAFAEQARQDFTELLEHTDVTLELPLLDETEYAGHPVSLSLSELFCDRDVVCTWAEYRTLLEQAQDFAGQYPHLRLHLTGAHAFRNVNITVVKGVLALVSKSKSPTIHFVIRHDRMVDALYHFVPPLFMGGE